MSTTGAPEVSEREGEVLGALAGRLTNAQIARQLNISVRTVESHVSSLLRKLGAADRRELAARAATLAAAEPEATLEFTSLPNRWTSFVGRDAVINDITSAMASSRLVTLVGPGGIGKTSLAATVAERSAASFPGGGAFVDLVPVSAHFVIQAVAAALGLAEQPHRTLDEVVLERLGAGRTLLVLDNCEHVLSRAATFVQAVLSTCRDAVVLATSRERLGVPGERVIVVPPLRLDDERGSRSEAAALFVDRTTSGGEVDAVADDAMVAEICRRLDGMPLAIELAAARSASLGVDGLLAGLDDRLRLLTSGPSGRHQSLRAVIDWSHELLDDDERAMFRRLGVFAGAFDLAAVVAVAAPEGADAASASDIVGRLTDKSLLVHRRGESGSRWRMLETVHAYAREQLEASGEGDEVRRRHVVWAEATAAALEAALDGDGWQADFDVVVDDLRAALEGLDAGDATRPDATGQRLALELGHLSYARRFLAEARGHYEAAVALAPDPVARVAALRASAWAAFAEMRGAAAFDMLMTAARLAEESGDRRVAALILADAADVGGRTPATFVQAQSHEALVALVERARRLAPADDLEVAAHLALAEAWNSAPGLTETDPGRATEALELARALDDPVLISDALDAVGAAAAAAGRYRDSMRDAQARLELLDRLPRHEPRVGGEVADIFHMGTEAAVAAGDLDAALSAARRSLRDSLDQGLAHFGAAHMVVPLTLRGDFDDTLARAEAMRDGWERFGRPPAGWMAPSFFGAAFVHGLRGDDDARRTWWDGGLVISFSARRNGFGVFVGLRLALHQGDLATARELIDGWDDIHLPMYGAYVGAMAAEVAAAGADPDAERRLEEAAWLGSECDFALGVLTRARGRLSGDDSDLAESVAIWERVGARFERAATLAMISSRRDEGLAELSALGCTPPAPLSPAEGSG